MYLDKKGNSIYYNFFDKKGYIVPKGEEQRFSLIEYRYSIILIVLVLLGDYFKTFSNTLAIGIAAAIVLEIYFRFFFLKKYKTLENFNRDNKVSKLKKIIQGGEKEKAIMRFVAYGLLSVLVVINAFQQNYDTVFLSLSCILSAICIYSAGLNAIAFTKIKK